MMQPERIFVSGELIDMLVSICLYFIKNHIRAASPEYLECLLMLSNNSWHYSHQTNNRHLMHTDSEMISNRTSPNIYILKEGNLTAISLNYVVLCFSPSVYMFIWKRNTFATDWLLDSCGNLNDLWNHRVFWVKGILKGYLASLL